MPSTFPEEVPPDAPSSPSPHATGAAPAGMEVVAAADDASTPPDSSAQPVVEAQADSASNEAAPADAGAAATPAAAAAKRADDLSPAACAAKLAELFPALFASAIDHSGNTPVKPIKLRVHADIQARAPGVFSKRTLGIFFSRYTTTTPYLKALAQAPHRFDLDGQPAGEIADEHRQAAGEEVERRRAIAIEKRMAMRRQGAPGAQGGPRRDDRPVDASATGDASGAPAGGPGDGTNTNEGTPAREPRDHRARPPHAGRENDRRGAAGSPGQRQQQRPPHQARPRPDQRPGPRGPRDQHVRRDGPAPRERHAPHPHDRHAPRRFDDEPRVVLPSDPAQRERALLLRAFESTTLSKSNFCALKRMAEADLDAQVALARQERDAARAASAPQERR